MHRITGWNSAAFIAEVLYPAMGGACLVDEVWPPSPLDASLSYREPGPLLSSSTIVKSFPLMRYGTDSHEPFFPLLKTVLCAGSKTYDPLICKFRNTFLIFLKDCPYLCIGCSNYFLFSFPESPASGELTDSTSDTEETVGSGKVQLIWSGAVKQVSRVLERPIKPATKTCR